MTAQWTMTDAWVFSAIEGTGPDDGYSLVQVVAKGDGINHAILTEAEVTQAIPRLLAAGLIGADPNGDCYWHTKAGQALHQRWMNRGGLFSWIDVILPALRRRGEPQDSAWSLPAGAFDGAVRQYLEWADTVLRRGSRPAGPPDG